MEHDRQGIVIRSPKSVFEVDCERGVETVKKISLEEANRLSEDHRRKQIQRGIETARAEANVIDRAVHNSPPPMDDVGGLAPEDFDPEDPDRPCQLDHRNCAPHIREPHPIDAMRGRDTEQLLSDRTMTHGRFEDNARIGQMLRSLYRTECPHWHGLSTIQREALDMIAGKISRILSGQGGFADHWDDIAGYAKLALDRQETRG